MNKKCVSLIALVSVLILAISLAACASTPTTTPTPTPTNEIPIEVVSVSGPLQPINPGGPIVEMTLKNVSPEPVVSLNATLELGIPNRTFIFEFNVTSANPLLPDKSTSTRLNLIGGGFSDNISYPLTINGILKSGVTFAYNKEVRIFRP